MKQRMMFEKYVVIGVAMIGIIGLVAEIFAGDCRAETIPTAVPGKLILALDKAWPPFQFTDEKGAPTGFDVDLAVEIGKHLGLQTELIGEEWTKAQNLVKQGKADFLLSCSPSADRAVVFDFKEYSHSVYGIVTLESNPYAKIEDIFGKKVGKKQGAAYADALKEYISKFRIPEYATMDQILAAMGKQEIDAALVDVIPFYYIANNTQVKLKTIWEHRDIIGLLVKKGNLPLAEKLFEAIMTIQQDGTWDSLNTKWFGQEGVAPKFEKQ